MWLREWLFVAPAGNREARRLAKGERQAPHAASPAARVSALRARFSM
jgi:hypothetical protein